MMRACVSLSITHGPAIRKSGFPAPRRSLPSSISRVAAIEFYEDTIHPNAYWTFAKTVVLKYLAAHQPGRELTTARGDTPNENEIDLGLRRNSARFGRHGTSAAEFNRKGCRELYYRERATVGRIGRHRGYVRCRANCRRRLCGCRYRWQFL